MVQGSARDDDDTEKSVATTRDIDMSVETEADAAADDQDAVGTRLLKTRKAFVDEQEKKVEEKRNLYLQSLSGNYQRQTTHNYLTWIQNGVQQGIPQVDMDTAEPRQRRDDDFGETDEDEGGVQASGYQKKSVKKSKLLFLRSMPENLVNVATGNTNKVVSWWDRIFGRKAGDKMVDSSWYDSFK